MPQIFVGNEHIGGFDDLQASLSNGTFPLDKVEGRSERHTKSA